MRTWFLIKIND